MCEQCDYLRKEILRHAAERLEASYQRMLFDVLRITPHASQPLVRQAFDQGIREAIDGIIMMAYVNELATGVMPTIQVMADFLAEANEAARACTAQFIFGSDSDLPVM